MAILVSSSEIYAPMPFWCLFHVVLPPTYHEGQRQGQFTTRRSVGELLRLLHSNSHSTRVPLITRVLSTGTMACASNKLHVASLISLSLSLPLICLISSTVWRPCNNVLLFWGVLSSMFRIMYQSHPPLISLLKVVFYCMFFMIHILYLVGLMCNPRHSVSLLWLRQS